MLRGSSGEIIWRRSMLLSERYGRKPWVNYLADRLRQMQGLDF